MSGLQAQDDPGYESDSDDVDKDEDNDDNNDDGMMPLVGKNWIEIKNGDKSNDDKSNTDEQRTHSG